MTTLTEGAYTGDVLLAEFDSRFNREAVTIASGADLGVGSVLSRIRTAASAAKTGGNTGNGTLTLDATTPVLAGAKIGVYTVRAIAASTDAATFRVTDPDGLVLGDIALAGTFANGIKFVIADGATDFAVGDGFDVTVSAGNWKLYDPENEDGAVTPEGILIGETALAASAAVTAVALTRGPALVRRGGLVFGAGVDNLAKRNAAVAALARLGIVAVSH